MKKFAYFGLLLMMGQIFSGFFPLLVKAMPVSEIEGRNACGNQAYELAYANTDGTLTTKSCHDTYPDAKSNMDQASGGREDDLVILERESGKTKIIDAKYAIVDLNKGTPYQNTNILNSGDATDNTTYTYINGYSSYGAVDAAYIERNHDTGRIKIKIGGLTGWVREIESGYEAYHIVPLNWVKSTTKYVVTSSITHYTTGNIYQDSYNNSFSIGPKVDYLPEGTYYSYDGIYFYGDRKTMLDDYKNNTNQHAVNANAPYYNYYLYLPHHTKTTYSGSEIDAYLADLYDTTLGYNYTMLYGNGYAFYHAQEVYGVNALLTLSVARNESANGRSTFAMERYNLFGHNAYDSNPSASASGYASIRAGIDTHAYRYITYQYSFPSDYRFYGGHLGNKLMGANVKYAADPYWGEKAAANYYSFDLDNGLKDYGYYQIAIKSKSGTIYPSKEPNTKIENRISTIQAASKEPYYNYGRNTSPVVILEEVQGEAVDGNTTWYKIMSDVNIDQNKNYILYDEQNPKSYDWENNYVYVPASYYTKINQTEIKSPLSIPAYEEKDYTYETYMTDGVATPKVAKVTASSLVQHHSPTLSNPTSRSWAKDSYILVFERAIYQGNTKAYQINATTQNAWREWISPNDIAFTTKSYGKMTIQSGTYANVRTEPGGDVINGTNEGITEGTYFVILDERDVNGTHWVQVNYDGRLGWVVAKDNEQEVIITRVENYPPELTAQDITLPIGKEVDLKQYVSAYDPEEGDITNKVTITSSNVQWYQAGTYQVTFTVSDNGGLSTSKTVQITIQEREERQGLFAYQSFTQVEDDIFEVSGFLGVAGMDNTQGSDLTHTFILENQQTKETYHFDLDMWTSGYPYEMSNIDDDKPYNYNGGWFKDTIDLSKVPQGDYITYVQVKNGIYQSTMLFQNLVYGEMTRKAEGKNNRGYLIQMNYYTKSRPLDIFIRDEGLLANDIPPTSDKMFNLYEELRFDGNELYMRGTSHNVGIDYSPSKNVTHEVVLERIDNFKRTTYPLEAITNGDYTVELKVSDGLDKTKAWFEGAIDISSLEVGTYAIYLKTTVDDFSDFGELKDLSYREAITTDINGRTYTLKRNDQKRFRMELIVQ